MRCLVSVKVWVKRPKRVAFPNLVVSRCAGDYDNVACFWLKPRSKLHSLTPIEIAHHANNVMRLSDPF
jgi:hypothetical protein